MLVAPHLHGLVVSPSLIGKAGGCSLSSNSLGELPGVPAQPGHLVAAVPGLVLA